MYVSLRKNFAVHARSRDSSVTSRLRNIPLTSLPLATSMGCASSNQRQDQRSAGFYTLRKQQTADLLRSNAAPQPESLADPPLSAAITRRVSDAEPRTEGGQAGPPGATLPANGSAAPAQPPWDVFVSHRGPDTKMGFVDALQRHMKARRVFVDRVGLQPGQRNWETIRCCSYALAVLLPDSASHVHAAFAASKASG